MRVYYVSPGTLPRWKKYTVEYRGEHAVWYPLDSHRWKWTAVVCAWLYSRETKDATRVVGW